MKSYGLFVGLRLNLATELSVTSSAPVGCTPSDLSLSKSRASNANKALSGVTRSNSSGAPSVSVSKLLNVGRLRMEVDPMTYKMDNQVTCGLSAQGAVQIECASAGCSLLAIASTGG